MRHGERTVRLQDGREVSNFSEDWRAECEARHVLAMPTRDARLSYVWGEVTESPYGRPPARRGGVAGKRGDEAAKRLEAHVRALWEARRRP